MLKSVETILKEFKKSKKKHLYIIDYYYRHNTISSKYIFANNDKEAIKKANVKYIIDMEIQESKAV